MYAKYVTKSVLHIQNLFIIDETKIFYCFFSTLKTNTKLFPILYLYDKSFPTGTVSCYQTIEIKDQVTPPR